MLKNYLKVALRTLRRRPGYTAINVGGLAVGLACCLLIGLYVQDELSYDNHFERADRIFRLVTGKETSRGNLQAAVAPPAWGAALHRTFPDVQNATRIQFNTHLISVGKKRFKEKVIRADTSFFEVFGLRLLRGDPETALDDPSSVVLSERTARKYFGNKNPVGQTLTLEARELEVTGVMENIPKNTHFHAGLVKRFPQMMRENRLPLWNYITGIYTYLVLTDKKAAQDLEQKLPAFLEQNMAEKEAAAFTPLLQPLTSIHLYSDRIGEIEPGGDIAYVYLFSAVALLVLLIACVNFMNLATARSTKRAQEVGMRKALGARRLQLATQFLGEAVFISGVSVVMALVLTRLALPVLNVLSGKELALLPRLTNGWVVLGLFLGALLVGVVAGSYPAFYLSSFVPTRVLRGGGGSTAGGGRLLRKGLVAFQFAAATALIIGTAVVYQQLIYVQSKNLGFDKERVVSVPISMMMHRKSQAVKSDLLRQSGVQAVSLTSDVPGNHQINLDDFRPEGAAKSETLDLENITADPDFAEVLGLDLASGRWFSEKRASDSTAFVVNEAATRKLGWTPEEAVGKRLEHIERNPMMGTEVVEGRVIGVVRNYHFASLREQIKPVVFDLQGIEQMFAIRIRPGNTAATLDAIKDTWTKYAQGYPYTYSFLDEAWEALYHTEQRVGRIFAIFAGLAVFIACLGLFGLAAFAAERRRKEIAVRKTFGATTRQLVALLSKDFLKIVAIGFLVAAPLAWLAMQRWLSGFAYRIELGPLVFVAAGALALVVALAATGTQALRAARANPAQALRDE